MKYGYYIIVALGLLLSLSNGHLQAQDPSFSQFYAARTYLNPAFTGIEPGLTMSAVMRDQWAAIPGSFRTYFASVEIQEPAFNSGIGFTAFKDTEGASALTTENFGIAYMYSPGMKSGNFHIGFRSSWVQKYLDCDRLVFPDQVDAFGSITEATMAQCAQEPVSYIDTDFGLLWRFESGGKRKKRGQKYKGMPRMHNSIGVSLHHITKADESLVGFDNAYVPLRITAHAGSIIEVDVFRSKKRVLAWSPNVKYDFQNHISVLTGGFYLMYGGFFIGSFYQSEQPLDATDTNALIFTAGAEARIHDDMAITFGYSYDANTTGLGTSTGGVHEITTKINFSGVRLSSKNKRRNANRFMQCRNFF